MFQCAYTCNCCVECLCIIIPWTQLNTRSALVTLSGRSLQQKSYMTILPAGLWWDPWLSFCIPSKGASNSQPMKLNPFHGLAIKTTVSQPLSTEPMSCLCHNWGLSNKSSECYPLQLDCGYKWRWKRLRSQGVESSLLVGTTSIRQF